MTTAEEYEHLRDRTTMLQDIILLERAVRALIRWGYDGSAQHIKALVFELKRRAEALRSGDLY